MGKLPQVDVTWSSSPLADSRLDGRDLSCFRTFPCALGSISPACATAPRQSDGSSRFNLYRPRKTGRGHALVCAGVQLGRSGVLRTGQDLVTDPRRQSITSQRKSESRHLNRSQPLHTAYTRVRRQRPMSRNRNLWQRTTQTAGQSWRPDSPGNRLPRRPSPSARDPGSPSTVNASVGGHIALRNS